MHVAVPFFRQHAVKFSRASGTMSFGALTREQQQSICNSCPGTEARHNRRRLQRSGDANAVTGGVLLPAAPLESPSANDTAQPAIRNDSVRFPRRKIQFPAIRRIRYPSLLSLERIDSQLVDLHVVGRSNGRGNETVQGKRARDA